MIENIKKWRILATAAIADVILLDQISKWLVMEYALRPALNEKGGESLNLWDWIIHPPLRLPFANVEVLSFFDLVMVWNRGVSFGMFSAHAPIIFVVLSLGIAGFFMRWLWQCSARLQMIALPLIIGGAVGNSIDRMRFGAVADFLDLHAFGWHYPAFNIADSAIVIGIALLVIDSLLLEPKRNKGHI